MDTPTDEEFLKNLDDLIDECEKEINQLHVEYLATPSWRFIHRWRLDRAMNKVALKVDLYALSYITYKGCPLSLSLRTNATRAYYISKEKSSKDVL